jgi:hypothetical protein
MAKQGAAPMQHGGTLLPAVEIVSYNVELKDDEGFIGDRASKGAFATSLTTGGNRCGKWVRTRSGKNQPPRSRKNAFHEGCFYLGNIQIGTGLGNALFANREAES